MKSKIIFLLVNIFFFTQLSAETSLNQDSTKDYSPEDISVKQELVYFEESNELFNGKIIVEEGSQPSFIKVDNGEIIQAFIFTPTNSTKIYFKNRKRHYLNIEGDNKPMEIKYVAGRINSLTLESPTLKVNASFDEKSQVSDFNGIYNEYDLDIKYKDQIIVYQKLSSGEELERLDTQHEKFPRAYSKMNSMLAKMAAASPSYSSIIRMLSIRKKELEPEETITLEQCKTLLGEEEFSKVDALFRYEESLLKYCTAKAKSKKQ